jgi:NDP-sugar pyrophosphorylase family protein
MKTLQILMPMGGLGKRFKDAGIDTPKPLIEVLGVPMFKRALAAYDSYDGDKRYYFVVRQDTDEEHGLAQQIKELLPEAGITILDHNTQGAAETCLEAEKMLDPELPVVIMDCDISFDAPEYFERITEAVETDKFDGVLLSFTSTKPAYSFAEVDSGGYVVRTAEKQVISDNALAGAYFFTRASDFFAAAHELINRQISDTLKEYYISHIYNIYLDQGKKVGLAKGKFYNFGTPDELAAYEAHQQPAS